MKFAGGGGFFNLAGSVQMYTRRRGDVSALTNNNNKNETYIPAHTQRLSRISRNNRIIYETISVINNGNQKRLL